METCYITISVGGLETMKTKIPDMDVVISKKQNGDDIANDNFT